MAPGLWDSRYIYHVCFQDRFVRLAKNSSIPARQDPAYNKAIRRRHAAILGICALVDSYPYTVEKWMPDLLTNVLAEHTYDPVRMLLLFFWQSVLLTRFPVRRYLSQPQLELVHAISKRPTRIPGMKTRNASTKTNWQLCRRCLQVPPIVSPTFHSSLRL